VTGSRLALDRDGRRVVLDDEGRRYRVLGDEIGAGADGSIGFTGRKRHGDATTSMAGEMEEGRVT